MNGLESKLEELGLNEEQLKGVMNLIVDKQALSISKPFTGASVDEQIAGIQGEMANESDWRKRASAAARIISLRLN